MKVDKLKVEDHPALGSFEMELTSFVSAQVHYLVGPNGAGKTSILDLLHILLSEERGKASVMPTKAEVKLIPDPGTTVDSIARSVDWSENFNVRPVSTVLESGAERPAGRHEFECPVVLSLVEINFSDAKVQSKTADIPEEDQVPKEAAKNLNQEIPQLLVDIEDEDKDRLYQAQSANEDWTLADAEENTDLLLPAFRDAYNEVMTDHKTFERIERADGGYQILFRDREGQMCDLNSLSTGEKQVIYRLGFILKNLSGLTNGIILIDEPEVGLHPKWQQRLMAVLRGLARRKSAQLIVATHSPFVFKDFDSNWEECIEIDRTEPAAQQVSLVVGGAHHKPSAALVGYRAFGLPTPELFYEIYSKLKVQSRSTGGVSGFDDWLFMNGLPRRTRSKTRASRFPGNHSVDETRPTWLRNKLSHPEIADRDEFYDDDLAGGLDDMLKLLT